MTDFTPDFGGAPGGYQPVGDPLFLGLPPLMLLLILALLAVVFGLGWTLRGTARREDDPDAVAKALHAKILAASKAALSAESDRLVEKSRALKDLVDQSLGDVVKLGGGLSKPLAAIQAALDGKGPAPKAEAAGAGAVPPQSVQTQVVNVTVNPAPAPPAAGSSELSGKAQTAALAAAVRDFHDWWARKDDRVKELKGAREQLSRRPAGAHDDGHGHGHGHDDGHGHGHDDHAHADEDHGHDDHGGERRPIWDRRKK